MQERNVKRLAVLIDADNVSPAQVSEIFKTVSTLGEPIVRRAYGMVNCFSVSGGWNVAQREYGIVSKPQVSNVSGKNVADIALVIDAMEMLYKSSVDGICIVSSDSDFTALAAKIREEGNMSSVSAARRPPRASGQPARVSSNWCKSRSRPRKRLLAVQVSAPGVAENLRCPILSPVRCAVPVLRVGG